MSKKVNNNQPPATLDFGQDSNTPEKTNNMLDFGQDEQSSPIIIKVIGVGGGGGNAVNHMYMEGIHDVSFMVCNTDAQALKASNVPVQVQLGNEGLGAGNKPEVARQAAEDTADTVRRQLDDGTKMVFITAGMGGGTGTGAAPIIARLSKEQGILTVGIVTIPFLFEGPKKIDQALNGVEEMAKHVDALLVINNERLRELYPDFSVMKAFEKADDILSVAAKSIAEIITVRGIINLDFNDVKTVLKDGGVAIMSTGYGEGEGRVKKAIEDALNSPLLNENDVYNSKKILLSIAFANNDEKDGSLMMEEMNEVNDFMSRFGRNFETKWGLTVDDTLEQKVKVTILATGFGIKRVDGMEDHLKARTVEEEEKRQEEMEKEQQREDRRNYYYKTDSANPKKKIPNIYLFKDEDLDNEEVIAAVEESPTYSRSRAETKNISNISNLQRQPENIVENTGPVQSTISF